MRGELEEQAWEPAKKHISVVNQTVGTAQEATL